MYLCKDEMHASLQLFHLKCFGQLTAFPSLHRQTLKVLKFCWFKKNQTETNLTRTYCIEYRAERMKRGEMLWAVFVMSFVLHLYRLTVSPQYILLIPILASQLHTQAFFKLHLTTFSCLFILVANWCLLNGRTLKV